MAKNWIQKAINPEHKGYCTPMTKSTCTPRRKALAKRFKSGDLSHADGGKLIIPSGVVPIFSTEYEDGGVMYFLGGSTGNKNNEAMVGGAAQLGLGIATGDPGSIVSGAAGFLTGNIKNMGTVLKDKDSSLLEKGLSLVNPIAGGIFANQARKRENEWNESANMFKERNSMLGIKANGGSLTEFNNGGSHETNQLGGIPQGVAPDGQVNKVEQGETKWQDYIFSDRLMIDESTANNHNLPKTVIGKTFADASKKLSKISKERPNDPISKGTLDSYMNHLMMANDDTRVIEQDNTMAMGGHIYDGLSEKTGFLNLEDQNRLNEYLYPSPTAMISPIMPKLGSTNIGQTAYYPEQPKLAMQSSNLINNAILKQRELSAPLSATGRKPQVDSEMSGLHQGLEVGKLNAFSDKIKAKGLADQRKLNLGFFKDSKNLRYAPIAFDALAATGLFGKTPTPTEYSPTLISQPGYLTPEQIDEQTMRSAIDTSYNTGISSLAEASGGSGAALRSGITGLSSGYARTLGEAFSNANRANIEQRQGAKQFNLQQQGNIAAQNVNALNQAELYNNQIMNAVKAKNYEDRMSYLAKGAEGLGDIGYEERNRELMPKLYGYSDMLKYYLENNKPKVGANGGRLRLKNRKK